MTASVLKQDPKNRQRVTDRQRLETRMTASVLKQDPKNRQRVANRQI